MLKKALASVRDTYDFIVIDCPPSLGLLTLNAFTAADSVLIPIGFGISGTVGVVALNLVLGGLIGGVILIWKLAVAVWYLPLIIYRLVT